MTTGVVLAERAPSLAAQPVRTWPAARFLVALSCVLYVARGWERLWSPRIFAEDGQIFMSPAHNDGLAALGQTYAGYLHLAPRLVAAVLEPAPLTWLPTLYAWASMAAFLAAIAPVLSSRIAWLLPSRLSRAVAFLFLCLLPTGEEVYGNLSNLIFVGGLTLALFAFSDDPASPRGRAAELVAIALLGLSGPIGAVLAPGFVWRWWRNGRSRHSARVVAVIAATATVQAVLTYFSDRETPGGGTPLMVAQAISERVAGGWLYGDRPLFTGEDLPLVDLSTLLWVIAAFTVAVVALRTAGAVGWLLIGLTIGAPVWAYSWWFLASATAHQRHVLIPLGIAVVLLVAAVAQGQRVVRVLAVVLLLAGAAGVTDSFTVSRYLGGPNDMAALKRCVDAGQVCTLPIYDGKWRITLRPPESVGR